MRNTVSLKNVIWKSFSLEMIILTLPYLYKKYCFTILGRYEFVAIYIIALKTWNKSKWDKSNFMFYVTLGAIIDKDQATMSSYMMLLSLTILYNRNGMIATFCFIGPQRSLMDVTMCKGTQ